MFPFFNFLKAQNIPFQNSKYNISLYHQQQMSPYFKQSSTILKQSQKCGDVMGFITNECESIPLLFTLVTLLYVGKGL